MQRAWSSEDRRVTPFDKPVPSLSKGPGLTRPTPASLLFLFSAPHNIPFYKSGCGFPFLPKVRQACFKKGSFSIGERLSLNRLQGVPGNLIEYGQAIGGHHIATRPVTLFEIANAPNRTWFTFLTHRFLLSCRRLTVHSLSAIAYPLPLLTTSTQ